MTSGPLDQDGDPHSLRSASANIPRIRNPVVDSWNDGEDLAPRPAVNRFPGAMPFAAPAASAASPSTQLSADATQVSPARLLVPVLAMTALFLFGSTLMNMVIAALPVQWYLATWRYTTMGAISTMLTLPLLAVTLATGAALLAERKLPAKLAVWIMAGVAAAVLVSLPFYLLDAVQVRLSLDSALRGKVFIVAVAKTVILYLGTIAVLLTNAWVLYRAVKMWSKNDFSVAEWQK